MESGSPSERSGVRQALVTVHIINGNGLCVGRGLWLNMHTPHAFTVACALEGRLRIRFAEGAQWHTCTTAVIAPDVTHELVADDGVACTAMIGPDSRDGRRLAWETQLSDEPSRFSTSDPHALYRQMVDFHAAPARRPIDPRVLKALRLIRKSPSVHIPVIELAAAAGLSSSRFVHLFREQTNSSIKRYSLWLRVVAAFRSMAEGESSTNAAYDVGFADPAHLSRTCQRLFGVNPSDVIRSLSHRDSFFIHRVEPNVF